MSIWTKDFWRGTAERVIVTAAQAGILAVGLDVAQAYGAVDVFTFDWRRFLGLILGGAILSLLKCLAANGLTGTGPSLTRDSEVSPDNVRPTPRVRADGQPID